MAKTARMRFKIVEYLKEHEEASFTEIFEHLNDTTRHGTTSQQLGNVLSKSIEFRKCDRTVFKESVLSGGYNVTVWALED